jgi:hypothetical protein
MDAPVSRASSSEPRFDLRTLVALAGGLAVAAIEAKAGRALSLPSPTGSWELPGHDLAATRRGGRIAGTHVEWRAAKIEATPTNARDMFNHPFAYTRAGTR